ncbi:MAG: type II secretion system protein [Phycisphaerales bacterium]|nr:type II secretion system protein [Phycisphaerales bacterium]MCB9835393.1 type II secretion system protein [Phycisphaera sp.]
MKTIQASWANSSHSFKADRRASAFTLIDVLVTLVVIAVLIGIMLPSLSVVKETTRRVVCSSNIRQIGLGITMFADDNDGLLPSTTFTNDRLGRIPAETNRLRIASTSTYAPRVNTDSRPRAQWDGLGYLYSEEYLETPGIFYCPSHQGRFRESEQMASWKLADSNIAGNFQYRGEGPDHDRRLFMITPRRSAIVSDSIRSQRDLNHESGMNVLRADLAVFWFSDLDDNVMALLTQSTPTATDRVWAELDGFVGNGGAHGPN